jgi:hypothetical protein
MPTPSSPRKEALTGYRGSVLHFLGDPSSKEPEKNYEYFEDGLLLVGGDGLVVTCKDATEAIAEYSEEGFELVDCSGQVRISIIRLDWIISQENTLDNIAGKHIAKHALVCVCATQNCS